MASAAFMHHFQAQPRKCKCVTEGAKSKCASPSANEDRFLLYQQALASLVGYTSILLCNIFGNTENYPRTNCLATYFWCSQHCYFMHVVSNQPFAALVLGAPTSTPLTCTNFLSCDHEQASPVQTGSLQKTILRRFEYNLTITPKMQAPSPSLTRHFTPPLVRVHKVHNQYRMHAASHSDKVFSTSLSAHGRMPIQHS